MAWYCARQFMFGFKDCTVLLALQALGNAFFLSLTLFFFVWFVHEHALLA